MSHLDTRHTGSFHLRSIIRWLAAGAALALVNIPLLYLLVHVLALPLLQASLLAGELGLIARFLVNTRWVFRQDLTWRRMWQFHIAAAGGFVVWWSATNILSILGVHYLLAATVSIGFSLLWNMCTNFLWVWRVAPRAGPAIE